MAAAIDVHAHHLPAALGDVLARRDRPPRIVREAGRAFVDCGAGLVYPLLDGLCDPGHHAGPALLSAPPPGVDGLAGAEAVAVARAANDELAELARDSGGRLGALALLPLAAPDRAAEELARAAGLGLAGAQLLSNAAGRPLDAGALGPLLVVAAELRFPLVLHPTVPIDRTAVADHGLLTTLGFVFDTSACAARLVLGGVFERHPELVLLLPHAGAALPPLLGRFDYELELMAASGRLSAPASEQLRLLHVDSVCESPGALRLALDTFGAERVLFGSDEPFWSRERSEATLDAVALTRTERELIAWRNAERVFRSSRIQAAKP